MNRRDLIKLPVLSALLPIAASQEDSPVYLEGLAEFDKRVEYVTSLASANRVASASLPVFLLRNSEERQRWVDLRHEINAGRIGHLGFRMLENRKLIEQLRAKNGACGRA